MTEQPLFKLRISKPYQEYVPTVGGRKTPHPKVTLKEFLTEGKEPVNEGEITDPFEGKAIRIWSQTLPGGFASNIITEEDI